MTYIKHPDQRVAVFVDVSNMFHAAKREGATLNFSALLREAVAGRKLVRAIAYAIKSDTEEEKSFFNALQEAGFEVRLKDLKIFTSGKKKGDWDVGLAVDMISLGDAVDVMVLVSGDGDYVPAVEYLRTHGRLIEVVSFLEGTSTELVESVDDFLDMSKNPRRFLIKQGRSKTTRAPRRQTGSRNAAPSEQRPRRIFGKRRNQSGATNSRNTRNSSNSNGSSRPAIR